MNSKKNLTPGDIDRFTTNGLGAHLGKGTPAQDALVRKYNAEMAKKKASQRKSNAPGK